MTSPTFALPVDLSPADLVAHVAVHARKALRRLTARLLAFSVMFVLATGTTLSIVTTTQTNWWQLHFSELGTFDDFSGHTFNTTLMVAGILIAGFAVRVRIDLVALTPHRRVRPSRILTACMVSVGLNLLGVGLVPLNTFEFMHDRFASGIMLSFLGLLVVVIIRRRHVNRLLLWGTVGIATGLAIAIAAFIAGLVNLAALELVGFTLIFVWVGIFTSSLEKGIAQARHQAAASETAPRPAVARRGALSGWPARRGIAVAGCTPARTSSRITSTGHAAVHRLLPMSPHATASSGTTAGPPPSRRCGLVWQSTLVAPPTAAGGSISTTVTPRDATLRLDGAAVRTTRFMQDAATAAACAAPMERIRV
jgi:hypothetical membrane protein